jgi:hypothetical protein
VRRGKYETVYVSVPAWRGVLHANKSRNRRLKVDSSASNDGSPDESPRPERGDGRVTADTEFMDHIARAV